MRPNNSTCQQRPRRTRTIIIGDVHGCSRELEALLEKSRFDPARDVVYFLGDIINRGPDSKGVYQQLSAIGGRSVLGNHEYRLLWELSAKGGESRYIRRVRDNFGELFPEFMNEVLSWPSFIETDEFILVHGGVVPDKALEESDPFSLTSIRTWDRVNSCLGTAEDAPWFDYYRESKVVVFGHWAALNGVTRENVIGIDTGCVYGKRLTALVLPEKEWVSVPAESVYCSIGRTKVRG